MGVQFPEKKRYVTLEWPLRIMVGFGSVLWLGLGYGLVFFL